MTVSRWTNEGGTGVGEVAGTGAVGQGINEVADQDRSTEAAGGGRNPGRVRETEGPPALNQHLKGGRPCVKKEVLAATFPAQVLLLGDAGSGKTSLMSRLFKGNFSPMYKPTTVPESNMIELPVGGEFVTMQVWDSAGRDHAHASQGGLFRDADLAILVFDTTVQRSFESIQSLHRSLLSTPLLRDPHTFPFLVLGNKVDAVPRAVTTQIAALWCRQIGAKYFEVSAKNGTNVEEAFAEATRIAASDPSVRSGPPSDQPPAPKQSTVPSSHSPHPPPPQATIPDRLSALEERLALYEQRLLQAEQRAGAAEQRALGAEQRCAALERLVAPRG
ncbi:putative Rab7/RabGfamily small GTPase [Paratrimastix pyriformis]|uniref:Rab7/RabGfamily small GTPase n=1 Tax=Paratrimastix pyriformis TaxID=342808 RepID=A0ABQ8U9P7_9EUKA|nr:putative Rab7/RabGfamily small GTPase [Paratrimastix pyriformis]